MQGWRVHPAGVQAVQKAVVPQAEDIETGVSNLEPAATSAVGGADSALVSSALQAFFEATNPLLTTVQQRIPAAMRGLTNTATAVIQGDDEMATLIDAQSVVGFSGYQAPPGTRQPR